MEFANKFTDNYKSCQIIILSARVIAIGNLNISYYAYIQPLRPGTVIDYFTLSHHLQGIQSPQVTNVAIGPIDDEINCVLTKHELRPQLLLS